MSNHSFAISVSVHHPRLKSIFRISTGEMSINLGDKRYDHISLLVTDEEWREIVRDVDREIAKQSDPNGALYCGDCSYIGTDADDLTEHVFANHPGTVAK